MVAAAVVAVVATAGLVVVVVAFLGKVRSRSSSWPACNLVRARSGTSVASRGCRITATSLDHGFAHLGVLVSVRLRPRATRPLTIVDSLSDGNQNMAAGLFYYGDARYCKAAQAARCRSQNKTTSALRQGMYFNLQNMNLAFGFMSQIGKRTHKNVVLW